MRREERSELRMLLRIGVVTDQRGLAGEFACDLRMPGRESVPGRELLRVDIASVGGLERGRGISVDDGTQRFSFLRDRWGSESDGKRNCDQQSRYTVHIFSLMHR